MRPGGNKRNEADENAYDSVAPSGASGSKAKPPKGDALFLCSTVDKENRQGRPVSLLYFIVVQFASGYLCFLLEPGKSYNVPS